MDDEKTAKPGDRVGVILEFDDKTKTVKFLGYGEYVGDYFHPHLQFDDFDIPLIQLDNGGYVWGNECWWYPENEMDPALKRYPNVLMVELVRDDEGCIQKVKAKSNEIPEPPALIQ